MFRCYMAVSLWVCSLGLAAENATQPNIILILVDDMGYTGVGCFGNRQVATPNMDRLAAEGLKLTDAYVTPQCTPTRASLLTGQHTARMGMWHVPGYHYPQARLAEPAYVHNLPRETVTVAEVLRDRGYATACIGKWHLHSGTDGNYGRLFPEAAGHHGFEVVQKSDGAKQIDKGVSMLTDEAIGFIEQYHKQPFFLYLSHYTVHTPVSATPPVIERYRQLGYPAAGGDQNEGRHNATYLSMIDELDQATGRLLDRLDALDLADNTVVIFLSDNGGVLRCTDNGPLRWGKGSPYEGGIRVPMLVRWPGHVKPGTLTAEPVHVADLYPTLLEMAGAAAPANHPLDGISLVPLMTQSQSPAERDLFFYMPHYDPKWGATPCAVVRRGRYKLVEFFGDTVDLDRDGAYTIGSKLELYDLIDDIGERRNLAESQPDRTADMHRRLRTWIQSMGRPVPGLNPKFNPDDPWRVERLKG